MPPRTTDLLAPPTTGDRLLEGAAERLKAAIGLRRAAWMLSLATLRHTHPEWSEQQVQQETARRFSEPIS